MKAADYVRKSMYEETRVIQLTYYFKYINTESFWFGQDDLGMGEKFLDGISGFTQFGGASPGFCCPTSSR